MGFLSSVSDRSPWISATFSGFLLWVSLIDLGVRIMVDGAIEDADEDLVKTVA